MCSCFVFQGKKTKKIKGLFSCVHVFMCSCVHVFISSLVQLKVQLKVQLLVASLIWKSLSLMDWAKEDRQ